MIPAYKEEVKIIVSEQDNNKSLEEQLMMLKEQVRRLSETVSYFDRERSRMKAEIESLRHLLSK